MTERNPDVADETESRLLECARMATDCQIICEACWRHCAAVRCVQPAMAPAMEAVADCATVCRMLATLAARRSPFIVEACRFAADTCDHCALIGARAPVDMQLAECVDECRECARVCREVLAAFGRGK